MHGRHITCYEQSLATVKGLYTSSKCEEQVMATGSAVNVLTE